MVEVGSIRGEFIIDDSQANDTMRKSVKETQKVESAFGNMVKAVFSAQVAYAAFQKVLSFGKQKFAESIKNARDLNEETNKFKVVFKGVVPEAIKMRNELVKAYGMSRIESTKALSAFQDFLVPMGIARKEAAELSDGFIKMAVDIGSFNNAPTVEVLEAIKSGIAGMSRPMRQFGVDISENTLKQMALAQGMTLVNGVLDRQDRAFLIAQKIAKDSADAMGDFGRTSEDLANRQKRLSSLFEDISSNLGERLLPALNNGAGAAIQLASSFERMTRVKLSDELAKEQIELNTLVSSITNVNTPTEERTRLIGKLNKEYPGFLEKLNKEKVTNKELKDRLNEVNDAYINRIIIQKEQENIEALTEKVANKRLNTEKEKIKLNQMIMTSAKELGVLDKVNGEATEDQIEILRKAVEQREKANQGTNVAIVAARKFELVLHQYNKLQGDTEKAENRLTKAQELKKKIIDSLKMSEEELIKITTKSDDTGKKEIETIEEKNELTKEEIKLLEDKKNEEERLQKEFADLQKDEAQRREEDIQEKAEAYKKAGVDRIAVEQWAAGEIQKIRKEENNNMLSMFADISNRVAMAVTDTGNYVADGIGKITNTIFEGISNVMEGLKTATENMAAGILEIVAGIGQAIAGIYEAIAEMQTEAMEAELEAMQEKNTEKLELLQESKEEQLEEIQDNYDAELEALQTRLDNGEITEEEFAEQKAALDKKKAADEEATTKAMDDKIAEQKKENRKKEDEQKKKIFEANKANQIAQIWIQTAIGVVSAFAGACQWPGVSMIAGLIFAGVMSGILIASAIAQTIVIGQQSYTPGMATGGVLGAGESAIINERGTEIITPGVSSYVTPASISKGILENVGKAQGKTQEINVSFDGAVISNQMDLEYVTDYVISKIGQKVEV